MDKYYQSIVDLPLNRFIELVIKKNNLILVIEGNPTAEDLDAAHQAIMMEYNDEMRDAESELHFKLLKETELLRLDLAKIDICTKVLESEINYPSLVIPDKTFADDLNSLVQSNFPFDHKDPEQFKADIKKAASRSKSLLIKYEMKRLQLEGLNTKNNTKVEKPTHKYFVSLLNILSKYLGYEVREDITVLNFCDKIKKYNEHIKYLESQQNKR